MRDIIWTVIIVWLVWRIIDAFKAFSQKTSRANTNYNTNRNYSNTNHTSTSTHTSETPKKGHLKPGAGEYVDYEETK